jgi:hypothetical protein
MHQRLRVVQRLIAMHDNIGTGCMQPATNRRANAPRATGNQRSLVVQ